MKNIFSKITNAITLPIPLYVLAFLVSIGITSGFGLYPKCNKDFAKPDTVYIGVPTTIIDTCWLQDTTKTNNVADIDIEKNKEDTSKVDFKASNFIKVGDNGFIKENLLIENISKASAAEIKKAKPIFKTEHLLPTIYSRELVPIHLDKAEKQSACLKGSLITIVSEIIIGGIVYSIYYFTKEKN